MAKGSKLAVKVLGIIGITLSCGFLLLGALAIWLQYSATLALQTNNTRDLAAVILRDIDSYMMVGESEVVDKYITELKEKKFIVDLKIFNAEGKVSGAGNQAVGDPLMLQALSSGKPLELTSRKSGEPLFNTIIPLPNEERCHKCHDAEPKFLGGISLVTSLKEGYDSAFRLAILLVMAGSFSFFVILGCMYLFFRKAIINNIYQYSGKVKELASGEGDLTTVIPVFSDDEIGQLADGINQLTAKLREIISKVVQTTSQVVTSANHLRQTAEQMAAGAEEAASQISTVATASEEMAATSTEIAQNCVAAADSAEHATGAASLGSAVVMETVSVMKRIAERVKESSGTVEGLGNRSDQIGAIVETIQDIADQTNLLALNAAIEAARAGEQGRGFAVVADEVRALAERTTRATREISDMIRMIQQETRSAVNSMEEGVQEVERGTVESAKSGEALQSILDQISRVTMQVNQIATAAEEQNSTTGEISQNMTQVTEIIGSANVTARDTAHSAGQLTAMAEELKTLISQFKL